LCVRFGIKNEHAHTALSDARATFELYKKLIEI
jgi:DNA polymerase III epsilon subunit-like protein